MRLLALFTDFIGEQQCVAQIMRLPATLFCPPIATPFESVLNVRDLERNNMPHVVGSANRGLGPFEYGDRLHAPGQDLGGDGQLLFDGQNGFGKIGLLRDQLHAREHHFFLRKRGILLQKGFHTIESPFPVTRLLVELSQIE